MASVRFQKKKTERKVEQERVSKREEKWKVRKEREECFGTLRTEKGDTREREERRRERKREVEETEESSEQDR